jgi:spore coat protein H
MNRAAKTPACLLLLAAALAVLPAFPGRAQTGTNQPGPAVPGYEPNLPVVFLDAQAPIVSDQRVACTLRVVFPKGASPGQSGLLPGVVRIHGATSQGLPKKSYALTLEAPAPLLDLAASRHWILNAACIDRSLMRHKLSYDLFRSLSSASGRRCAVASRFVEVHLNGRYNGAYLLMERVDRQLLGFRAYNSNEVAHACLYKAVDHAANFGQAGHAGYEQREPDPTIRPYWEPLDDFNRFVSSTPDAVFFAPQAGIAARLDLDNAIDFHLLVLLTSNSDGITKNFFVGRDGQEPGPPTQRFLFAPWDYDGTFGRNWDASIYPADAWLSNHLFDRLLSSPAYRDRFTARWNHLRQRQFSAGTIQGMMDSNARVLGEAVRRNAACWPPAQGPYPDQVSFEQDLAQMKAWTEARIKWLDQEINQRYGRAIQTRASQAF